MRILYIDVDSLRPDHLGAYGYHRDTSPNIDSLAEDGRRFTNYYVSDAPCLPSRTALFSGRFGIHNGVVNHGGLNAEPRRSGRKRGFSIPGKYQSWMRALDSVGIHTASVSPFPDRHDGWHVLTGIREFHNPQDSSATADLFYDYAESWLQDNAAEDDWFLHVNFWDPHTAYNTPESYGNPFADVPAPEWPSQDEIDDHYASYGPHSAFNPQSASADWSGVRDCPRMPAEIRDRDDYKHWVDGYDVGVHYMDHHVGKLMDLLREKGVFEDTLVIVSADHGENLGELNVYGDHQTADEYTCNVPLILNGPEVEPGIDDDFHYHVDLAATVTDMAGGAVPEGWDGQSFAPAVTEGASDGRDYVVISQGAWACQRGVRWDDWLLLKTYDDGLKPALEDVMLFNLAEDPHETTNLADEKPDVVADGMARLQEWHDARMVEAANGENGGNPDVPGGVTDPMWDTIREGGPLHAKEHVEPYASYLRESGRTEQADELLERLD